MKISRNYAQNIVEEMEVIIKKNINMMNVDGKIIASTDPKRINTTHEGALKIITEQLDELVIEKNHSYEGTREGINLPITFNNEIVGVIGITGKRDEVISFGNIIKKMTEILIFEMYAKEQHEIKENTKNLFIEDWIMDNKHDDNNFKSRANIMGIDIEKPRIFAITHINSFESLNNTEPSLIIQPKLLKLFKKEIKYNENNLMLSMGRYFIFLFDETSTTNVKYFFIELNKKLAILYKCIGSVGISNVCFDYKNMFRFYQEAEKALKFAYTSPKNIVAFETIDLINSVIIEIPHKTQKEYIDRVFTNCSPEEIIEIVNLLDVFFKNNSSLSLAANELFIHKNTLQYRIKKIINQTSLDPRMTSEAFTLYLAVLMMKNYF